jgi:endoglycosylceramidase
MPRRHDAGRLRRRLLGGALLIGLAAAGATSPPASAAALPRLHADPDPVRGGRIADDRGREVLLRGVNVNSFGEYWRGAAAPPVLPFGRRDADRIAAIGWNVVRLIASWSRVEPAPGRYDGAYLDTLARQVRLLAARGVYTILDLHQDAWSATLAASPDEACPAGTKPALGWDGAPAWATLDGGMPRCYAATRELSPAVQHAWSAFFADAPAADGTGIQSRYVAMLAHLARRFARSTSVAGIDVMNEPGALDAGEQAALGPFYARAVAAIRRGERAGRGARHLVLFEPSVLWSLTASGAPPRFAADRDVVYAPHLYGGSIGARGLPDPGAFATARREARGFGGAPVLTGEWGADPARAQPGSDEYFDAHQRLQDAFRLSATLWTWKQSCGDPHDVLARREGPASPTPPWSVFAMDCAGGRNAVLGEHRALVHDLRRGYVRAAPGRLTHLAYRPATRTLTARGVAAGRRAGRLEAFFPARRPRVRVRGLAHVRRRPLPGGATLVSARRAAPRWALTISP